jgi:alpha-galactosidase
VAVGVVNMGAAAGQAKVKAGDLQLSGAVKKVRDLWAHQDVKLTDGAFEATVPSHGVLLLRVSTK